MDKKLKRLIAITSTIRTLAAFLIVGLVSIMAVSSGSARVITTENSKEVFEFSLKCFEKGRLESQRACVAVTETSVPQSTPRVAIGQQSEMYLIDYDKSLAYSEKYEGREIFFANATVLTCKPKNSKAHLAQLARYPEHVLTMKVELALIGKSQRSLMFSPDRSVIAKKWPVDSKGNRLPACNEAKSRAFK